MISGTRETPLAFAIRRCDDQILTGESALELANGDRGDFVGPGFTFYHNLLKFGIIYSVGRFLKVKLTSVARVRDFDV